MKTISNINIEWLYAGVILFFLLLAIAAFGAAFVVRKSKRRVSEVKEKIADIDDDIPARYSDIQHSEKSFIPLYEFYN